VKCCINVLCIFLCVRVIGLPPESDWPDGIPVPWSSFKISRRQPLEKLVPNMEPEAFELLKVKLHSQILYLDAGTSVSPTLRKGFSSIFSARSSLPPLLFPIPYLLVTPRLMMMVVMDLCSMYFQINVRCMLKCSVCS